MTMRGVTLLAGAAALLAVVVASEWLGGVALMAPMGAPARLKHEARVAAEAAGETGATPAAIAGWVHIALARPLMTSSRRPAPSGSGGAALNDGLPRLAGTILTHGSATAIFAREEGGDPLIVHNGGVVGPYHVMRILDGSVTVEGPDGVQTLHPRFGPPRAFGYTPPSPYMPPQLGVPGAIQPPGFFPPRPPRYSE